MKKFKSLILSFLVLMVSLSISACGNKDKGSASKETPVVNAVVTSGTYYADNKLSTVIISLSEGDTAGTISWNNPNTVLLVGENEYEWKFTPTDTSKYKSVTGKVKVATIAQTLESISVKSGYVSSGYKAFDIFNTTGFVILASFDGGKVEEITTGYEIKYSGDNETFVAGDTKITILYAGMTAEARVDEVSKVSLQTPSVTGDYIYNSQPQTAVINNEQLSMLCEITNNEQTYAGEYDIELTIKDTNNYKWEDSDEYTKTIKFNILKAEQNVQKQNYKSAYDKNAHSATISSDGASSVYYSLSELSKDNYVEALEDEIEYTNAMAEVNIYYYAVGDKNHNDASGYVTIEIVKANSVVETDYTYAIEYQNKKANIPLEYVKINGEVNTILAESYVTFEYYLIYLDENIYTKTTSEVGASVDGGAPSKIGKYYVKTTFAGDNNYNASYCISELFIDEDNSNLFAHGAEDAYDWFNKQTSNYLAVKLDTSLELVSLTASFKLNGEIVNGIVYVRDGATYAKISGFSDMLIVFNETFDVITVGYNETTLTLDKFVIPYYVGEYERDAKGDGEYISELSIYNDYGVIRFTISAWFEDSGEMYKLNPQSGIVNNITASNTLHFLKNGDEKYFTAPYTDGTKVTILVISRNGTPPDFGGEYVKI